MKNPMVSILTPFKNTEAYLAECLNSIISQTYTNWELLIVDDFSSDQSYNIVKGYAEKDDRIKLFKNSENGIIKALQLAFKHSKGEFITRMDSDDIMVSNKLETLTAHLQRFGKHHIALGLVHYFSDEGIKEGFIKYETWLNSLTKTGSNYSEIYKECVIPSPCWMIYRSDLIACGAFNPNRYPEDYDLAFRFYKHRFKCIPCNAVIHKWRDYSMRTSRTHKNYADNHFIELKLHYFLELDFNKSKTLTVWGAGIKGKKVAKILIGKDMPFKWICDNPNKIGQEIYGIKLQAFNSLEHIKKPQSIITVANENAQKEIKIFINTLDLKPMEDYVFFC